MSGRYKYNKDRSNSDIICRPCPEKFWIYQTILIGEMSHCGVLPHPHSQNMISSLWPYCTCVSVYCIHCIAAVLYGWCGTVYCHLYIMLSLCERWQLDTSMTPLPMIHVATGYKTMRFTSMGNTSMRYISTGNGRSKAHNYYKFALQIYGACITASGS